FFFQAEDGIRDRNVTGVQTCALPISISASQRIFIWWESVGCVTLISSSNLQAHFSPERSSFIILKRFSSQNALKIAAILFSSIRSEERRVGKECISQCMPGYIRT